jgi:hypothetical protein
MNNIFTMNIEDYLTIMEDAIILGKERGKKKGDNIEQEFAEIAQKKGLLNKIKHLGTTDKDMDLLCGDLREEGLKIINVKEIERRNQNG